MEKITIKNKIKGFWEDNRQKIVYGGLVAGAVIGTVIGVKKIMDDEMANPENDGDINESLSEPYDFGRDCLMTFTVEETGEVLGVIPVAESYFVDDWKDLVPTINEHDYGDEK